MNIRSERIVVHSPHSFVVKNRIVMPFSRGMNLARRGLRHADTPGRNETRRVLASESVLRDGRKAKTVLTMGQRMGDSLGRSCQAARLCMTMPDQEATL
ncbi:MULTISPECIES: hypothetical protein [Azotobacter]|uniref:hypothetical protein n=1 Tax=Azotobacter TaxID=352 RepID=UPI001114C462|nr:hypothetical protein [Azotobacter vinelandii]WKN21058.1 hypothetical protein AVAEIV_004109 [Azotobacter vinelandii]